MEIKVLWDKDSIRNLLMVNDRAVKRALVVLHDLQTHDERMGQTTRYRNNMGFNSVDAKFASSLAEQVKKGRELTQRQIYFARKILVKYSGQLANIANSR